MPPKKAKKISLNEFLGDSTLGSWADEMEALPNAPAMRSEEDQGRDRYSRRDDFLSSKPDRVAGPPREDLPLPTAPPYTAFVGNLAFDITEADMESFFSPAKMKSIKIIKDRDEKPKGFGYIEFEELDGLKEGLEKSGQSLAGRTVRVSVAEPPKERSGFGASDEKFDAPWRRDGPLPDLNRGRDSSRRQYEERLPSVSEGANDWRSSRPMRSVDPEGPPSGPPHRKGSGFASENQGAADQASSWTIGSRFKPSNTDEEKNGRDGRDGKFGSLRSNRGDMGPPPPVEENDWRKPRSSGRSPNNSTPPTPQMGRRKLELLPKSGNASNTPSPLSSPKMGPTPNASATSTRSNPFGNAKPVDVSSREKEVQERLEKDREATKERLTMSRTSSRTGVERPTMTRNMTPPTSASSVPPSPRQSFSQPAARKVSSANVRPSFSFASAAGSKRDSQDKQEDQAEADDAVASVTEKVAEASV